MYFFLPASKRILPSYKYDKIRVFMKTTFVFKLLAAITFISNTLIAQYTLIGKTLVGGRLEGEQIWTLAGSPYLVIDDLEIAPNASLVIEPGVVIGFNEGMGMRVEGVLKAWGTAEKPVIFTIGKNSQTIETGYWKGIHLAENMQEAQMKFCYLQHADTALKIQRAGRNQLSVLNSGFFQNKVAIDLNARYLEGNISSNFFRENEISISLGGLVGKGSIAGNTFYESREFDVVNRTPSPINLSGNCWDNRDSKEIAPKIKDGKLDRSRGVVDILPFGKNCTHTQAMIERLGGGDITIVLDDDLIGTGVDPQKKSAIFIYPNPARDVLSIEIEGVFVESTRIYDALGRVVWKKNDRWTHETTINVSSLKPGMYFLSLFSGGREYLERVVILQ